MLLFDVNAIEPIIMLISFAYNCLNVSNFKGLQGVFKIYLIRYLGLKSTLRSAVILYLSNHSFIIVNASTNDALQIQLDTSSSDIP
jgi:hypothetical protein